MPILNDYRCTACGSVQEQWTGSPAPSDVPCQGCGAPASRLFAAVGLGGRASAPAKATPGPAKPSLCTQYPMVPGLCHMSESAGRMMVAKYTRNSRAIESELSRQEARAATKPLTMQDAITHNHHPSPAPPTPAA